MPSRKKITWSGETAMIKKKTEGKRCQEKMQEFELTFYFKGEMLLFFSTRGLWMQHFINVCVWAWILHPYSCAASARCWQDSWTRVKTWLLEQPGSEGYQIVVVSGTHSHATFLQGNFVFAKYPIPTARSRSLFRTNAHSNVNVGLRSRHEKIIARVEAH